MDAENFFIKNDNVAVLGATSPESLKLKDGTVPNVMRVYVADSTFVLEIPIGTSLFELNKYAGELMDWTNRIREEGTWR